MTILVEQHINQSESSLNWHWNWNWNETCWSESPKRKSPKKIRMMTKKNCCVCFLNLKIFLFCVETDVPCGEESESAWIEQFVAIAQGIVVQGCEMFFEGFEIDV